MSEQESEYESEEEEVKQPPPKPTRARAPASKAPKGRQVVEGEHPALLQEQKQALQQVAQLAQYQQAQQAPLILQEQQKQLEQAQQQAQQQEAKTNTKNARNAGRKKGSVRPHQKISEFQQSKIMSESFKEFSDMLIALKREVDEQKKTLTESLTNEEAKHKKETKEALHQARLMFARTLNR